MICLLIGMQWIQFVGGLFGNSVESGNKFLEEIHVIPMWFWTGVDDYHCYVKV